MWRSLTLLTFLVYPKSVFNTYRLSLIPYPTIRLCAFKLKSDLPQQEFYVMNSNTDSKIAKPGKYWAHPSPVEIVIGYHQAGDDFRELAAIAHESRKGVLQYEDFLEVPRVLHYAKQMADYVLMLDDDESDN